MASRTVNNIAAGPSAPGAPVNNIPANHIGPSAPVNHKFRFIIKLIGNRKD